ncbi:MAG: hypothetical protein JWN30_886 [Bacilli bacterium]|nr:hypothetical protein [Bacilli bacterium]
MKSRFSLLKVMLFLVIGVVVGSILGDVVARSFNLPFLAASTIIHWHPSADFSILKYDFDFQVKLNLASIAGLALGYFAARKF